MIQVLDQHMFMDIAMQRSRKVGVATRLSNLSKTVRSFSLADGLTNILPCSSCTRDVSRRLFWRCNPFVRDHERRSGENICSWQSAAKILGRTRSAGGHKETSSRTRSSPNGCRSVKTSSTKVICTTCLDIELLFEGDYNILNYRMFPTFPFEHLKSPKCTSNASNIPTFPCLFVRA